MRTDRNQDSEGPKKMSGLNKAMVIGRLGRDPETKTTGQGVAIANMSIATSETWKDKSGQKQEKTEWHRVTAFNRLAEICGQYLRKGSQVYIEGRLQTRQYEKDGQTHYATEIIANNMQMLDSKGQAQDQSQQNYGYGQQRYDEPPNAPEVPF